jgi:hypothetical protein
MAASALKKFSLTWIENIFNYLDTAFKRLGGGVADGRCRPVLTGSLKGG